MSSIIMNRDYHPDSDHCCEACVFGTGEHASWCPVGEAVNQSPQFINDAFRRLSFAISPKVANESEIRLQYYRLFAGGV